MNKKIMLGIGILLMLALVSASSYRTIYNPYSGKLDFVQTSNFTGENITAYRFIGDGSGLYNLNNSNISGSQYWYNHTAQIYADDIYVNESGDTMTGNLNMSGNNITNVGVIKFTDNDRIDAPADYFRIIVNDGIVAQFGAAVVYIYQDLSWAIDNKGSKYGASGNSKIYYNASDLIIDPDVIGNGSVYIGATGNNNLVVANISGVDSLVGNSNNIRIGDAGTDTHALTANDDLFVSGKFEVDGLSYFDSAVLIPDEIQLQFGNGAGDAIIQWDTTQTPDSLLIGIGADSNGLLICEKGDEDFDFAHLLQSNPTFFLHSATQSTTEWGSFSHDTQKFQIDTGGVPGRMNNNTEVASKLDVNMDLTAGADLIVGDELSDLELLTIESNGTHIVYNSPQGLPHTFTGANVTGNFYYGEMWYHNHTATELNFAVDGVFYNLTFDNSDVNGFAFNNTADSLTAQIPGKYKVGYMASGDGQNNHIYFTTILVNGIDNDRCESHRKMTAGGDIVTMVGNCFVNLVVGDEIKLATVDVGGTGTGNYYSANVNLFRIGD